MTNDDIHNLFLEVVMKASDNPVSDHTHSIPSLRDLNQQYGSHSHGISPMHIGGNPYYGGQPLIYNPDVPAGKMYSMGGNVYANPRDFIQPPPTPKEPKMSTIEKIKAERREKREREELEAKFEAWDAALGSAADGDIYAFSVDMSNKTYRYAVIYVDKRWHLTGQTTCAMATEDFIAWLIEKDADIQNMIFMEPLT